MDDSAGQQDSALSVSLVRLGSVLAVKQKMMATWIVHLRVADMLNEAMHSFHDGNFALGNVAPDSGVPDVNWETFNPPSEVTHFRAPAGARYKFADMAFYHTYILHERDLSRDKQKQSFLYGYFYHLVTDNLWNMLVTEPTYRRYQDRFTEDPKFIWTVKKDWYGLDFVYLSEHPNWHTWKTFQTIEYLRSMIDIIPKEAVRQKIEHIKNFYGKPKEQVDAAIEEMPAEYLVHEQLEIFVETATRKLLAVANVLGDPSEKGHSKYMQSALQLLPEIKERIL